MTTNITGAVLMLAGIGLIVLNRRLARLFDKDKSASASRIILFIAFALLIVGIAILMKDRPQYG